MSSPKFCDLIVRKIDRHREELVGFLQQMVRINSVTPGPEDRYDRIAACIQREMEKAGLEGINAKNNVIGCYGAPDATPAFIFNGHMDTVELGDDWAVSEPLSGEIIGDRVYGRGAGDNKSAVAMSVYAARVLKELAEGGKIRIGGRMIVAATNEEELGGDPVAWLIGENIIPASEDNACLVGDGLSHHNVIHPCGVVNGCIYGSIGVWGKSCHGDWPQYGSNAIFGMNKVINGLREIQKTKLDKIKTGYPAHPGDDRDHPYIHVGQIQGGLRFNIVPSKCVISVTVNTVPEQDPESVATDIEREIVAMATKENIKVQVDLSIIKKPVIYDENRWRKLISAINQATGHIYGEPKDIRRMGGVTDLIHFVDAGIPSLLVGAQSARDLIHGGDESVSIESLLNATKIFALTAFHFLQAG